MKLLITAGATREPLDAVRFLSNVSTGATGATLAELFAAAGHRVTLLRGEGAVAPKSVPDQEVFSSALDLSARLQVRLAQGGYDAVIMSAAVSDYRAVFSAPGKIPSDADQLALQLVRNLKILPQLKSFSPKPLRVIGFKLTVDADEQARRVAVEKQFAAGGVDAVVHNDLAAIRAAPQDAHPFALFRRAAAAPEIVAGAASLVRVLDALLRGTPST